MTKITKALYSCPTKCESMGVDDQLQEVLAQLDETQKNRLLLAAATELAYLQDPASLVLLDQGRLGEINRQRTEIDELASELALSSEENEHLHALSTTDKLTDLLNRRGFVSGFAKLYADANRHNQIMFIGMYDIDHFKQVNDTYGHRVGDDVLRKVAKKLRESVRGSESLVSRDGGEEFFLAAHVANKTEADALAERLRSEVEQQVRVQCENGVVSPTISGGYTLLAPSHYVLDGKTAEDVVERYKHEADLALYTSKNNGRNRVTYRPTGEEKI